MRTKEEYLPAIKSGIFVILMFSAMFLAYYITRDLTLSRNHKKEIYSLIAIIFTLIYLVLAKKRPSVYAFEMNASLHLGGILIGGGILSLVFSLLFIEKLYTKSFGILLGVVLILMAIFLLRRHYNLRMKAPKDAPEPWPRFKD